MCFWCLSATMMDMERIESPLLSTGHVASLLGVSRQHVVDLCDRGDLIFVRVGSHRRVPRFELDRILGAVHVGKLTRDQERSLWLHRAVLGELVNNPEDALARVGGNLQHLRAQHLGRGMTARWLDQWQKVLDAGVDAVADVLTSQGPAALELRQNSPFAGVISQEVRSRVLAAFLRHWRRDHGQPSQATMSSDSRDGRVRVSG
jgi:excisionase family DNA binding protein